MNNFKIKSDIKILTLSTTFLIFKTKKTASFLFLWLEANFLCVLKPCSSRSKFWKKTYSTEQRKVITRTIYHVKII